LLDPSESGENDEEVEAAWDAEMDARLMEMEADTVQLLSAEESEARTERLFKRLGMERPGRLQ
jgi:hypothetical protein